MACSSLGQIKTYFSKYFGQFFLKTIVGIHFMSYRTFENQDWLHTTDLMSPNVSGVFLEND